MKHVNYRPARLSKGKKWYVSFQYRNPETGKFEKFRVYRGINRIHDKAEREEFGRDIIEGVNRFLRQGGNPYFINLEQPQEKQWTLGQALNYFKQKLQERGLRKRTVQSYESVIRMLNANMAALLNKPVKEIKKTHIESAFAKAKWKSNTTFNNNLTVTRAIFSWMIDADMIDKNPAKAVKPKPETITKHRYFDNQTWEAIKREAEPDLLEFILFLYHTGTRPNEARQIKYEHIVGDRLLIPGTISKNRKEDYVPLSSYIKEKYRNGKGFIFGTSVNYFNMKFQAVKKALKLPKDYTLYSIKHTRAVHLAQDNASPYEIMRLFRHHSLDQTSKYLRDLGLTMDKSVAEKGLKFG